MIRTLLFVLTLVIPWEAVSASDGGALDVKDYHLYGIEASYYFRDTDSGNKTLRLKLPATTKYGNLSYAALYYERDGEIVLTVPMFQNEKFVDQPVGKVLDITLKKSEAKNVTFFVLYGNVPLFLRGLNEL